MEPLYTMEFEYTLETVMRWNKTFFFRNEKRVALSLLLLAFVVAPGIFCFLWGMVSRGVLCFVWAVLWPVARWFRIRRAVRKSYETDKQMKDARLAVSFFGDRFEVDSAFSHSVCHYMDLYDIAETKTDFCLMLGERSCQIVPKADCPPELIGFLRDLKEKYGKKR